MTKLAAYINGRIEYMLAVPRVSGYVLTTHNECTLTYF